MGKLASMQSQGRTRNFVSAVTLAAGDNLGEAVSLEKFHSDLDKGRIIDALFALSVAAETAEDIHIGACRISDFVDAHGPSVRAALAAAAEATGDAEVAAKLLPEYIESGRFSFQAEWSKKPLSASDLVKLVTSPNCPPESIVPLVTELRNLLSASKQQLGPTEAVAVLKVLADVETWLVADSAHADMLAAWIATGGFRLDDASPFLP
jgi:hypothetical protein